MAECKDCVGRLLVACRGDLCRTERACLAEEAEARAARLDHVLSGFVKLERRPVWRAECARCGRVAVIRIDPEPGQPMIEGGATTVVCGGSTPS